MVSIAVMALLIGLMLPALSGVRETARRVACGSNLRQLGLGVHLFADANRERLPETVRSDGTRYALRGDKSGAVNSASEAMTLRFATEDEGLPKSRGWDGLGFLYAGGHLTAPGVFYCPSHEGEFRSDEQLPAWTADAEAIHGNYNLRLNYGVMKGRQVRLGGLNAQVAVVTDGFGSGNVLNHPEGVNVLRVDGSVKWFADSTGSLGAELSLAAFSLPGGGGSHVRRGLRPRAARGHTAHAA